jgi:hypothetical protein
VSVRFAGGTLRQNTRRHAWRPSPIMGA